MARVKRGMVSRRKHRKLLGLAKGYRQTRSRAPRRAKEAVLHAGSYAFHGRKLKKRNFRALWNIRIGEAARKSGFSYSILINKLKKSNVELDRKILSDLAVNDTLVFQQIIDSVKNA